MPGSASMAAHSRLDVGLGDDAGDEALLARVPAEDVGESRAQDDLESEVAQRPDGVLAAGAGAEVGPGDEDRRALVGGLVEHELGVLAPAGEQRVFEARSW